MQLERLEQRVQQLEDAQEGAPDAGMRTDDANAVRQPSQATKRALPHGGMQLSKSLRKAGPASPQQAIRGATAAAAGEGRADTRASVQHAGQQEPVEGALSTRDLIAQLQARYQDAFAFLNTMQARSQD